MWWMTTKLDLAVGFAKPHLPFVSQKSIEICTARRGLNWHRILNIRKTRPTMALTASKELRNYTGTPGKGPMGDVWVDHGWKLGGYGEWAKHTNFENDTNAPLLLSVSTMKNAGWHSKAQAAFSQYQRGAKVIKYSMRTERYRLTVWLDRKDRSRVDSTELYDRRVDEQENVNITNLPENAPLAKTLMAQWKSCWQGSKPKV